MAAARPQTAEEKKQTIAYLNRLQTANGAFLGAEPGPKDKPGQPSLRATTSAMRAYRYFGGEVPNKDKVIEFVKGCFNKSTGGFTDAPGKGKPDVFTTASGIMAVVDVKLPVNDYLDVVQFFDKNVKNFDELRIAVAGLEGIHKPMPRGPRLTQLIREINDSLEVVREKKGGDKALARMTGGMVVTLLRLGEKVPNEGFMLSVLLNGQLPRRRLRQREFDEVRPGIDLPRRAGADDAQDAAEGGRGDAFVRGQVPQRGRRLRRAAGRPF